MRKAILEKREKLQDGRREIERRNRQDEKSVDAVKSKHPYMYYTPSLAPILL